MLHPLTIIGKEKGKRGTPIAKFVAKSPKV